MAPICGSQQTLQRWTATFLAAVVMIKTHGVAQSGGAVRAREDAIVRCKDCTFEENSVDEGVITLPESVQRRRMDLIDFDVQNGKGGAIHLNRNSRFDGTGSKFLRNTAWVSMPSFGLCHQLSCLKCTVPVDAPAGWRSSLRVQVHFAVPNMQFCEKHRR